MSETIRQPESVASLPPRTGSSASPGKYVLKKHSPERDYICAISHLDREHKCDSMGELSKRNAYGELFHIRADYPDGIPVICGHGGSAWLCRKCCDEIMQQQNEKADLPPTVARGPRSGTQGAIGG